MLYELQKSKERGALTLVQSSLYDFVLFSIVSEDGASIYSVSEEAQKEMPNLDVNLRSAGTTRSLVITSCCCSFPKRGAHSTLRPAYLNFDY